MPEIGAHMSVAGGVSRALDRGDALGLDAVQIFTKNASQWRSRPLEDEERDRFFRRREETGITTVVAHDSYLINLASPERGLFERSLTAFEEELSRCEILGIAWLVMHPGAHRGCGETEGISRVGKAIRLALLESGTSRVSVLVETTAGQGTQLGYRFEHLRDILEGAAIPERVGVCLDTCHIFAAGYDIRDREAYNRTLLAFDTVVGLEHLKVLHVDDSKKGLGSRVDRHDHIGKGRIGVDAFAFLLNDTRLSPLPFILETPKTDPETQIGMDAVNVSLLRKLMKG
jgi:deoxyribonuclease-4